MLILVAGFSKSLKFSNNRVLHPQQLQSPVSHPPQLTSEYFVDISPAKKNKDCCHVFTSRTSNFLELCSVIREKEIFSPWNCRRTTSSPDYFSVLSIILCVLCIGRNYEELQQESTEFLYSYLCCPSKEKQSKMWPRWTLQRSRQEAEIKDLLQEVAQLKLRLSRIERRKNLSHLGQDFSSVWGKYAATTTSRSLVPTKSLSTDDNDKGILDDQIFSTYEDMFEGPPRQSSTPPLIESSFEEFEDSLPKSSSLPLYDEPVYDVYEDDMFGAVLGVDTPVNTDDKPIQEVIVEKNNGVH